MAIINKPNTFSSSTTISSSEVNDNFDTVYNEVNGSLSSANLATDSVVTAKIADSNVTTAKIADANVTTAKIADNAVTGAKLATGAGEPGGAWNSWTPSYVNITVGNGTVTAKYKQIGKTINFTFQFVLGSTSAVGTAPTISLPVTSVSYSTFAVSLGNASYRDDSGSLTHFGETHYVDTSTVRPVRISSGTWLTMSSTTPFTWATSDTMFLSGTYEAA